MSEPARGGAAGPEPSCRSAERALQALAFDAIGNRYSAAFPAKSGQLAAGRLLLDELEPGARVLDIGCGTGDPTVRQLAAGGLRVTAVDLSDGMLALARPGVPTGAAHQPQFHRIDLDDLGTERAATAWGLPALGPAGAGSFAAATAFFSLILLPQQEIKVALGRIRTLLRPGGLLALGLVEADLDDYPMSFLGQQIRLSGFLREELTEVLAQAGFTVSVLNGRPYAPACTALPPEEQLFLHCRRTP
ncbi:SAM-dependent methyltransferase [Streptomyces tateyamensis]|uniref:SAM-dependent methyltransferase n=1 Tax=Streptomyces tateyamensis TaxID=565073 RepID=A0A2V4NW08_9ACTN|nr:methyltransferase domain-containing protein [Streptomyces tateyamensis]PYC72150.1 SAM-dependent methyltransferase [Streptomyces tateyamensis]